MDPFAYGLRDHEVFHSPIPLDRTKAVSVPVPQAWRHAFDTDTIDALPLVDDTKRRYDSGWCTYTYEHVQAPELEILCGGLNAKTPKAGAVWRQGHLLHFGFQQSPAQLNENGRAMLVNSIVYISRFTEDRPIVRTPCVFVNGRRIVDRHVVDRKLSRSDGNLESLKYFLSPGMYESIDGQTREEIREWYDEVRGYVHADERGKLQIDEQARSFGLSPAGPDFFREALTELARSNDRTKQARRLLARYAPDGPGEAAEVQEWRQWWEEHRQYLFFSNTASYRWLIDPLAESRGLPTDDLRGPARATLRAAQLVR